MGTKVISVKLLSRLPCESCRFIKIKIVNTDWKPFKELILNPDLFGLGFLKCSELEGGVEGG